MRATKIISSLLAAVALSLSLLPTQACTDFLVQPKDGSKIVGRSMEWGADLQSHVWKYPRGQSRNSQTPDGKPGLTWKSKFGYVALDATNMPLAVDGLNEKGLSVGLLWMPGTRYQQVDANHAEVAVSIVDLDHWLLGNFSTVAEVKAAIAKVKVWAPQMAEWGGIPTAHLALHDSAGNSAVVEFIDGEQRIYDNSVGVLTNAPTFDWHRTNLNNYLNLSAANAQPVKIYGTVLAPPGLGGGFLGIPGDWTPPSRFVRANAMLAFAKPVATSSAGVNLALHILNAVDIPLGDARPQDNSLEHSDYTQWIVVKDLTNHILYFRSYDNLTLRSIDLKKLDFAESSKVEKLSDIAGGKAVVELN